MSGNQDGNERSFLEVLQKNTEKRSLEVRLIYFFEEEVKYVLNKLDLEVIDYKDSPSAVTGQISFKWSNVGVMYSQLMDLRVQKKLNDKKVIDYIPARHSGITVFREFSDYCSYYVTMSEDQMLLQKTFREFGYSTRYASFTPFEEGNDVDLEFVLLESDDLEAILTCKTIKLSSD